MIFRFRVNFPGCIHWAPEEKHLFPEIGGWETTWPGLGIRLRGCVRLRGAVDPTVCDGKFSMYIELAIRISDTSTVVMRYDSTICDPCWSFLAQCK